MASALFAQVVCGLGKIIEPFRVNVAASEDDKVARAALRGIEE